MTSSGTDIGNRPNWREAAQRNRRNSYLATGVNMAILSLNFGARTGYRFLNGGLRPGDFLMLFGSIMFSVAGLMMLCGWTGARPSRKELRLEDELTRAIRDRSLRFGFMILFASLLLVIAVAAWRPAWALTLLPGLPMIGVSAGLLRFVQLDHRAERGDV